MKTPYRKGERGQALAETALFAMLAVIMAFGLLAWIPYSDFMEYIAADVPEGA